MPPVRPIEAPVYPSDTPVRHSEIPVRSSEALARLRPRSVRPGAAPVRPRTCLFWKLEFNVAKTNPIYFPRMRMLWELGWGEKLFNSLGLPKPETRNPKSNTRNPKH